MDSKTRAILNLKLAAKDTSDSALIAHYTEKAFHAECLADSVERLEKAIREYKGLE